MRKVYKKLQATFFPTPHQRMLKKWHADGGDRVMRLAYALNADSLVLDLGGYQGQWASDIFSMYCCRVVVFEPVHEFAEATKERFKHNLRITVLPVAAGSSSRTTIINVCGVGSSLLKAAAKTQVVEVVDIAAWITDNGISSVDLMKVNIEGGEYELLERLLETGLVGIIRNLQVQFHDIDHDSSARMRQIQERLAQTHIPTYQYRFVWENWALK